jgi:hypothetical protein
MLHNEVKTSALDIQNSVFDIIFFRFCLGLVCATRTSQCRIFSVFTVCDLIFFRQQISFGRNQAKQWWPLRLQGIAILAEAGPERTKVRQDFAAQVLVDLSQRDSFGAGQRPRAAKKHF